MAKTFTKYLKNRPGWRNKCRWSDYCEPTSEPARGSSNKFEPGRRGNGKKRKYRGQG